MADSCLAVFWTSITEDVTCCDEVVETSCCSGTIYDFEHAEKNWDKNLLDSGDLITFLQGVGFR